jgi:hypothetical protein
MDGGRRAFFSGLVNIGSRKIEGTSGGGKLSVGRDLR